MDLPDLRHFKNGWILSDPVYVNLGEASVKAVYTSRGWYCPDLKVKLEAVTDWSYGEENEQSGKESGQSDERVQSRGTEKRQARPRQRTSRKKP